MARSDSLLRVVISCFAWTLIVSSAQAAVETQPPPLYGERVAPLLTPLAELPKEGTGTSEHDSEGLMHLRERLQILMPDGKRVIVYHDVLEALTDAGTELIDRTSFRVATDRQRVYVPIARTIAPDGSILDVAADAMFLQSPQYQADLGIYTDIEELVVIFPKVKPGHRVEYVVVLVEDEPRIENQFSSCLYLTTGWPCHVLRQVIELPDTTASRLQMAAVGERGQNPRRSSPRPGWQRLEWRYENPEELAWEADMEPVDQAGPAVWLTTFASWAELGDWYWSLLAERSELDEHLQRISREWSEGSETQEEIIARIVRRVADDIRYVGLEFGLGAFQPRQPAEVWHSQYGDCKDKANLARVLLAEQGIRAHVALINTEHRGAIETRTPSHKQFNHAILAVETEEGLSFFDPTVSWLAAGELPPWDSGRSALVVREEGSELVSLPPRAGGSLELEFELDMAGDGGLRGWFRCAATGTYAASYGEHFASQSQDGRLADLDAMVEQFFPGAEVVDGELEAAEPGSGSFVVRAFLDINGAHREGDAARHLSFPSGTMMLPELDDSRRRVTRYWQWQGSKRLQIRYKLPPGWAAAAKLPSPLRLHTSTVEATASWFRGDRELRAELEWSTLESVVEPEDFKGFGQAVAAARTWLARPLAVAPGETEGLAPGSEPSGVVAMPLMPTGEGQLRLVDRLFPASGSLERREEALLEVLKFFPEDPTTVFDAQMNLSLIESARGEPQLAADRITAALEGLGAEVQRDSESWARYLLAEARLDLGDWDRAAELGLALLQDRSLHPFRRATGASVAARSLAREKPAQGVAVLLTGIALQSEITESLAAEMAELLVDGAGLEELARVLGEMRQADAEELGRTLDSLVGVAVDVAEAGRVVVAARIAGLIRETSRVAELELSAAESLERLLGAAETRARIAGRIAERIEDPPEWWPRPETELSSADADALLQEVDRANHAGDYAAFVGGTLELLGRHHDQVDHFSFSLWQLTIAVERREPDSELFDAVLDWCLELPAEDEYYLESLFIQGRRLERAGELEAAEALYRAHGEDRELEPTFRLAFQLALGELLERTGDVEGALATYRAMESERWESYAAYNGFLRGALLELERGSFEGALSLLDFLRELDEDEIESCDAPGQVRGLSALAASSEAARRYWQRSEDWWPAWKALRTALDSAGPSSPPPSALISDLEEHYELMRQAASTGAASDFFDRFETLVSAARWQPELVAAVSAFGDEAKRLAPEQADLIRAFIVALNSDFDNEDEELVQRSQYQIVYQYFDWSLYPQVATAARDYLERFSPTDSMGWAVVRMRGWAAAETGIDLEPAVSALEQMLASEVPIEKRTMTVFILARALRRAEREDDEMALIEREILGRDDEDSRLHAELLEKRYHEVKREREQAQGFERAVNEWFAEYRPDWFEQAPPASLDEAGLPPVEEVCTSFEFDPAHHRLVKLLLLAAIDSGHDTKLREQCLGRAAFELGYLEYDASRAKKLRRAIIDDARFSGSLRHRVRDQLSVWAVLHQDRECLAELLEIALPPGAATGFKRSLERMHAAVVTLGDDEESVRAKLDELFSGPVDADFELLLDPLVERLLQLEADDAVAEALVRLEKRATSDGDAARLRKIELELRRQQRAHLKTRAAFDAMRDLLLEHFPHMGDEAPQALADLVDRDWIDQLDRKEAFAVRLYRIAHRDYSPEQLVLWGRVCRDLLDLEQEPELAASLVVRALAETTDDATRARFLSGLSSAAFDVDVAEDRERLLAFGPRFADPVDFPATHAEFRKLEMALALRSGQPPDPQELARMVKEEDGLPFVAALRNQALLQPDKGMAPLRQVLEELPTGILLDKDNAVYVLEPLRTAGLEVEAEMVAELAAEQLEEYVLSSWTWPQAFSVFTVLRLSQLLAGGPLYPDAWIESVLRRSHNRDLVLRIQIVDAAQRNNWEAAYSAASKLLELRPEALDWYWELGRAAAAVGHTEEARAALRRFLEHCGDSPYFSEARALLETLEP